ncbi:hypothetical protein CN918_30420 [Priestia megaterium]|nr:hypothetical protein CN918_30420 [Priestia megaterium]
MIRRTFHLLLATGLAGLVKALLLYLDVTKLDMFFFEYVALLVFSFIFYLLGDGGFYRGFVVLVLTAVAGIFSAPFLFTLPNLKMFFSIAGIIYSFALLECVVYKSSKGYRWFIHGQLQGRNNSREI